MNNEGYCAGCHKRFSVNDVAWNQLARPENGNSLFQLDKIHQCCSNPIHIWAIGKVADISQLVLEHKDLCEVQRK